jgi:hypothetical protein
MRRSDSRDGGVGGAVDSGGPAVMDAPQSAQNRPSAGAPQAGHAAALAVPQEGQKRAVAGSGSPHAPHVVTRHLLYESDCNGAAGSPKRLRNKRRAITDLA